VKFDRGRTGFAHFNPAGVFQIAKLHGNLKCFTCQRMKASLKLRTFSRHAFCFYTDVNDPSSI
jgi:hypothetical protein